MILQFQHLIFEEIVFVISSRQLLGAFHSDYGFLNQNSFSGFLNMWFVYFSRILHTNEVCVDFISIVLSTETTVDIRIHYVMILIV